MSDLDRLRRLLQESSDPENPDAGTLVELLPSVRTIAVVGASRDPLKPARRVPSYLAAKGMSIIPVNPNATWILGRPARYSLDDVRERIDLVLLFRPSSEVGRFVREGADRFDRPVLWLQEGIRDDAAAEIARRNGSTVVQDLCLFKAHRCLSENRPRPFGPTTVESPEFKAPR